MAEEEVKRDIDERIRERDMEFRKRESLALIAWSNNFLRERNFEAKSLIKDFADGVLLINLLELTFAVKLGKYRVNPRQPFHKLENVTLAFNYMEKTLGIRLLGIDTNDIVQKQEKQTINVLWNIMRTLVLRGIGLSGEESSGGNIRTHLLGWAANILGKNFDIKDFWDSFKDGLAFCGILNNLVPGSIDVASLKKEESEKNLTLAFSVAEEHLGIPALLQAADFASDHKPDEQAVMNYLCMLVSAAQGKLKTDAELERVRKTAEQETQLKEQEMEHMKRVLEAKLHQEQLAKAEQEKQLAAMTAAVEAFKKEQQHQADQEKSRFQSELGSAQSEVSVLKEQREKDRVQFEAALLSLQSMLKEKQEALVKNFDEERARLQAEIQALKDDVARLKAELSQLQALRQRENDEAAHRIKELTAQLYQAHREYEDVVDNFRAQMKKDAFRKRVVLDAEEQQDGFSRLLQASINQEKSFKDFILSLPDKTGWLIKKRPDNKVIMTGDRKRHFTLKGDMVYSTSDTKKPLKEQSYFSLDGYQLIDRTGLRGGHASSGTAAIDPALAQTLAGPKKEEEKKKEGRRLSGAALSPRRRSSVVTVNKKGNQVIRLIPKDPKKNKVLDLSTPDDAGPNDSDLTDWVDTLNTRISLINYLNGIGGLNRMSMARGGREMLAFICDPAVHELKIENKVAELHMALTHFKDILCNRKNLNICFTNVAMSDADCEVLAEIMSENEGIESVELVQNLISPKGAEHLAKALKRNSSLKTLRLDYNAIKDQGLAALADALFFHRTLSCLTLSGNNISDAGCVALVRSMLESQKKFGTPHLFPNLDLSNNLIGDKGMEAVGSLLLSNPTVQVLTMDSNVITDEGIGYIADAVGSGKTAIRGLHFSDNQLTSKGLGRLAEVFKHTVGEMTIDVSNNKLISRKGVNALLAEAKDATLEFVQFHIIRRPEGSDKEKGKEKEADKKVEEEKKSSTKAANLHNQEAEDF